MAATFNLLRGRDLIWNYVVNNYLLGDEPPPFDLLYWNSDTTNLPAGWHRDYLKTLYEGNKLAEKGGITIAGTPIDIDAVEDSDLRPGRARGSYRAAAKRVEDHGPFQRPETVRAGRARGISPEWSIRPPRRSISIGSTISRAARSKSFVDGAEEHKGSWWPDWLEWLEEQDPETVKAQGARIPGKGKFKAIEDAPGSYVKAR